MKAWRKNLSLNNRIHKASYGRLSHFTLRGEKVTVGILMSYIMRILPWKDPFTSGKKSIISGNSSQESKIRNHMKRLVALYGLK